MMKKLFRLMSVAVVLMASSTFADDEDPCVAISGHNLSTTIIGSDTYYEIGSGKELYQFACMVNNVDPSINGMLTTDITLNDDVLGTDNAHVHDNGLFDGDAYGNAHKGKNLEIWTPIGAGGENAYQGTFNGNNMTVSGVFDFGEFYLAGFFGFVGEKGSVKNVGVVDSYIYCDQVCGGVVGENHGSVSGVFYTGVVRGGSYAGGIIGHNDGGLLKNAYNSGEVYASSMSGGDAFGGIVGRNGGTVINVYNTGAVNAENQVGCVIGNSNENVSKAYYNKDICTRGGVGDGKTTAELAALDVSKAFSQNAGEENPWVNGKVGEPSKGWVTYTLPGFQMQKTVPEIAVLDTNATEFEISNADKLLKFAAYVNSGHTSVDAKLVADIVVNKNVITGFNGLPNINPDGKFVGDTDFLTSWIPIGKDGDNAYQGTFDGNGYAVSGLYFNNPNMGGVGLFGVVQNGTVKNVGVVDSYINGGKEVGGVVGNVSFGGKVRNVYNTGFVSGNLKVGGVVGLVDDNADVRNAYNTGSVSGEEYVGGVVGYFASGDVANVYNVGSVSGTEGDAGYVIGYAASDDVQNGYYNKNEACTHCNNTSGSGKTTLELYELDVTTAFPQNAGEENPWVKGLSYDKATGKFMYGYPYFKNQSPAFTDIGSYQFKVTGEVIQIGSSEDLKTLAKLVNEFGFVDVDAKLVENISLNDNLLGENNANVDADGKFDENAFSYALISWTPIGTEDFPYAGTFDGNGKTIGGLYLNDHLKHDVGLFGFVKGGTIQNVGVVDSYFYGDYDIGGVVGNLDGGKVVNCYNNGVVRAISKNVGGVVAYDMNGKISDSYNTGVVYGAEDLVGGVAGYVEGDSVINCYNTGVIDGPSYDIGGVVGFVKNGVVTNSYNTGSVNGIGYVGGVVGEMEDGKISNVYNAAEVNGEDYYGVGGLAGYVNGVEISNGYNTGSVKGGSYVGGIAGGSSESIIKNVYNSASVTGNESFGAVVGYCRGGEIGNAYYNTDLFDEGAVTDSESVAIVGDIAGKTAAQLIAGTSVTLDETAWAVGAKGENAKQDTLFYPYLKAFGSHLYVMGDIKKYTIAVAANDKTMGSVTGASGEYEYGTEIEISAMANEGYKFTDWQDDVKDAKRTIIVTKDETFTANFEKIQSSSSEAESSSSEVASSSSEDESSSSSSAKDKSSSSGKKIGIVATAQVQQFSVAVSGRMLSVVGIRPNTSVEVFDMQGNKVKTAIATSANISFALPSAGTYIVKNGYIAKRVNVR